MIIENFIEIEVFNFILVPTTNKWVLKADYSTMAEGALKDFKYGETSEKTFRIKDGKAHILQAKLFKDGDVYRLLLNPLYRKNKKSKLLVDEMTSHEIDVDLMTEDEYFVYSFEI